MEELIEVLKDIRDGINELNLRVIDVNDSIVELKGDGLFNSLSDIYEKVENVADDIKGHGLYNNMTDVCNKLDDIEKALHSIDMNTM